MQLAVKTKNLVKKYGKKIALNNVNISVPTGSIYGIVGRNGAGKTTLLRTIAGHITPSSGDILLFNESIYSKNRYHGIGSLIEAPRQYPHLTPFDNLDLLCIYKGIKTIGHIDELISLFGLNDFAKTKVEKCPTGAKQRLALAMAFVGFPRLVLLDEPINGLDPYGIKDLRSILKNIVEEKKITLIISSHILDELEKIATHLAIIDGGKILLESSVNDLHSIIGTKGDFESYYFELTTGGLK